MTSKQLIAASSFIAIDPNFKWDFQYVLRFVDFQNKLSTFMLYTLYLKLRTKTIAFFCSKNNPIKVNEKNCMLLQ